MSIDRPIGAVLRRWSRWCMAAALLLPFGVRADTVASLLGNFTVNQYCEVRLESGRIGVEYVVLFGQLPALRELHRADADGDGVTTQAERDAYVASLAPQFADKLRLTVDGVRVPLSATHWTSSLPTEQSGFSMRLDVDFEATLPNRAGTATLRFDNDNYAGQIGWHEVVVRASPSVVVFDTDGFDSSLTDGLKEALTALPANGPLDERSVRLRFGPPASVPAGARLIAARGQAPRVEANAAPDSTAWLQARTHRLVEAISAPQVPASVLSIALVASLVLGALHAFSPGHGKTIVGAYLIGSRSTPRHAVILGVTVTITHTLVVFVVGLATLFASRYILPERLFPMLGFLSGLLVLGMGIVLVRQRWPAAHLALGRQLLRWYGGDRAIPVVKDGRTTTLRALPPAARHGMRRSAATVHAHGVAHDRGLVHSHGGRMHSHLPPGATGEPVTIGSLVALGVSGGLVPCPSAMVLLLAAIALNKTWYGLLMVVAFSVGLALTLIAVGMAFLYARRRFSARIGKSVLVDLLPAVSGVFIAIVGVFLCYGALTSSGFGG